MAKKQNYGSFSILIPVNRQGNETTNQNKDGSSNAILSAIRSITVEPILFLYIISVSIRTPVVQALIYEKSCLGIYDQDAILCANDTATHQDTSIQSQANVVFMLSSTCLNLPSFVTTIFLGSLSDRRNRKVALLPFAGLFLLDISCIVQTTFTNSNVYLLLIGDVLFGIFGGTTSILGVCFSYAAKTTTSENRSNRMAFLEGSLGLGGTIGYLLSGIILNAAGYRNVFLIITALHFLAFVYACLRVTDSAEHAAAKSNNIVQKRSTWSETYFRDAVSIFKRRCADCRLLILLAIAAYTVTFFVSSGMYYVLSVISVRVNKVFLI